MNVLHILTLTLLVAGCHKGQPEPLPTVDDTPPTEITMTDVTEADTSAVPTLHEVVALEVDHRQDARRHTRDATSVQSLLAAMGDPATWEKTGMPRCRPAVWARLVPPSGEGGATVQLCNPDASAYAWVPGLGAYRLPDAASHEVYRVLTTLSLEGEGSIPPVVVTDHLGSLLVTLTANGAGEGQLHSVTLATGQRLEPDTTWPDGTPISESFVVDEATAAVIVQALAGTGFFHRGKRYHSEASETTTEPPAASTEGPSPAGADGTVEATVTADGWHLTWHETGSEPIYDHTRQSLLRALSDPEITAALEAIAPRPAPASPGRP